MTKSSNSKLKKYADYMPKMRYLLSQYSNIWLFSLYLIFCLSSLTYSDESINQGDCFNQIDSLIVTDDIIKVTNIDGQIISGAVKKISQDSLVIRYLPSKFQSPGRQSILTANIKKIDFDGIRKKNLFIPKSYTRVLCFSTAVFISYSQRDKTVKDSNQLETTALGIGFGVLLGEALIFLTTKKIPINISIQCN